MVQLEQILRPIVNLFNLLMGISNSVINFMFTPIGQAFDFIPDWALNYLQLPGLIIKLFPNQSLITIMFGGGILVFIVVTIIKWIIDILP